MQIAMWSGPRNLSTAMMYAFAQRPDCHVVDEPFYAAYLAETGLNHPFAKEILASQPQDYHQVIADLAKPGACAHQYEKHMTHHMLPGVDLSWLSDRANIFLIRHPARVVASYAVKRQNPTLDDIGFRQQLELFQYVQGLGQKPIVIDSYDIRNDPKSTLTRLCSALGLMFDPSMLTWAKGGNSADGIWASHWYGVIHGSVGFAKPEGILPQLDGALADIVVEALPIYDELAKYRL